MTTPDSLPHPFIPLASSQVRLASVGGKAMNLAVLASNGYPVPPGFFVPTCCYLDFLRQHDLDSQIKSLLRRLDLASPLALEAVSTHIRALFSQHPVPEDLRSSLERGWQWLGCGPVAVRSSATAEDLPETSFAGQQDTFLNIVSLPALCEAVVNCWSSLWTARAIGYRARNHIPHHDLSLAVVVQNMVPSEVSGVMFTANPLTGCRLEILIDATLGLGEALVSGQVEPDHYVVGPGGSISEKILGGKSLVITAKDGGGVVARKMAPSGRQALPDEAILQLADLGRRIAGLFAHPQDIEWAYLGPRSAVPPQQGQLFILQSRPITTLFPLPVGLAPEPAKIMFGFHVIQGILEPLTPLGQDTLKLVLTGAGRLVKLEHTIETQRAFYVAAERLWINITPLLRSPIGHRVLPRLATALDPGIAATVQQLVPDPRFAPARRRPSLVSLCRVAGFLLPFVLGVLKALRDPKSRRQAITHAFDKVVAETRLAQNPSGELWADFTRRMALLHNARNLFADIVIPKAVPLVVAGMATFFGILERFSRKIAHVGVDPQVQNPAHGDRPRPAP